MTHPPRPAHTHTWDGTTVPWWIRLDQHHFDNGQLVIRTPDGDARPRPGWTLIGWTDGTVTLASPGIAARVYGAAGVYRQLDQAEAEVQRLGDWCRAVAECATAAEAERDRYHGELAVNEADRVAAVRRAESAEATLQRVTDLYNQWVHAGPPPLGTPIARWWDARLAELQRAIPTTPDQQ